MRTTVREKLHAIHYCVLTLGLTEIPTVFTTPAPTLSLLAQRLRPLAYPQCCRTTFHCRFSHPARLRRTSDSYPVRRWSRGRHRDGGRSCRRRGGPGDRRAHRRWVTLPFTAEGERRQLNANVGLERLRAIADTVIVIPNDRLLEYAPNLSLPEAFTVCDRVLMRSVKRMTELITKPGLVNVDFADVKTIMKNGEVAIIGLGEADSVNKAKVSIRSALRSPLLDVEFATATNALINVVGGSAMRIEEAESVIEEIYERIATDARIIWGASVGPAFDQRMETMVIVTGVDSPQIYGRSEADRAARSRSAANEDIDIIV
jgi:hypothetical protein